MSILDKPARPCTCFQCGKPVLEKHLEYRGGNRTTIHMHTWCAIHLGAKLTRIMRTHYEKLERSTQQ